MSEETGSLTIKHGEILESETRHKKFHYLISLIRGDLLYDFFFFLQHSITIWHLVILVLVNIKAIKNCSEYFKISGTYFNVYVVRSTLKFLYLPSERSRVP